MDEETEVSETEILDESNQSGPMDNEPNQEELRANNKALEDVLKDVLNEPTQEADAPDGAGPEANEPFPTYLCHKEVQAAQILSVEARAEGGAFLCFEAYPQMRVSGVWMDKHDPKPGGYFVIYNDGYQSYSPQEAFEEGYSLKGVQPG